jgi:hypothetical protein
LEFSCGGLLTPKCSPVYLRTLEATAVEGVARENGGNEKFLEWFIDF